MAGANAVVVRLVAGLALCASPAAYAASRSDFDGSADASSALADVRAEARETPNVDATEAARPAGEEGAVWVSVGKSDLVAPSWAGSPLGAPVSSSQRASVFRVSVDRLPELSHFMHDKFGRCGGFFAYDTRAEAESDMSAPGATAGGPYTIDQDASARPLAGAVREAELRSTIETLAAFNNRYYQAETGVQASSWLQARWQALAGSLPGATAQLVNHGWKQPSVVLTIPGSEIPDELVVLGGHLDSINGWGSAAARAPGADDNASGIAVLTETIRILGEAGFKPKRTLQFMGYAAEEVGLRGSKEIASSYAQQGKKVVGVIQYDMTNFKGSEDEIYLLDDNVDAGLTAFLGKLIDAYVGVKWSTTSCGYACSDHASWNRSGYAASAAFESSFEGMNHSIHTERDTLAASGGDAKHSVAFARLAVAFAVEVAKAAGSGATPGAAGPGESFRTAHGR